MKKATGLLVLIFMVFAPSRPVKALENFDFKGELWARGALHLKQQRPYQDNSLDHETLLLQGEGDLSEEILFKAGTRLERLAFHGNGSTREDTRLELWETYLDYRGGSYQITLGNQIIRWGKTDEMTILDNLNPQDLRELMTLRLEERKHPWPWLRAQYFASNLTLEGVFTIWPVWHMKEDFGTDWAAFDHLKAQLEDIPALKSWARSLKLDKQRPGPSLRDAEWGFRLTGTFSSVDWEASFLHAHNRSFYYYITSFPIKGLWLNSISDISSALSRAIIVGNTIRISRPEDDILGLAFETTWGEAGLRGEFAYHTNQVFLRKDLYGVRKPCWQYVLGLDYQFMNGLYANLQFSQRYIQGWDKSILFEPRWDSGLFLRLSKTYLQDFLECRLDAYYDLTTRMYYLNPEVRYKIQDEYTLFMGLHLLDGPAGTFFDLYDANDQIYVGLKAVF